MTCPRVCPIAVLHIASARVAVSRRHGECLWKSGICSSSGQQHQTVDAAQLQGPAAGALHMVATVLRRITAVVSAVCFSLAN